LKALLKGSKEIEGSKALESSELKTIEHELQLEKKKNKKLTSELEEIRKLKDVETEEMKELKRDNQETKKCLAQTRESLSKMTQQFHQKSSLVSAFRISDERRDWVSFNYQFSS